MSHAMAPPLTLFFFFVVLFLQASRCNVTWDLHHPAATRTHLCHVLNHSLAHRIVAPPATSSVLKACRFLTGGTNPEIWLHRRLLTLFHVRLCPPRMGITWRHIVVDVTSLPSFEGHARHSRCTRVMGRHAAEITSCQSCISDLLQCIWRTRPG